MLLSLVVFGFLGGISGVVMGTEQINLIMHNTLYVPGHFHATVVGGTTLAFMAITYPLVGLIFQRELVLKKIAQWQPYVFGLGITGLALFMMGAGTLGVSRRHWDITFADAALRFDYPAVAHLMMGLNGLSAVLAALGGLMYVLVVVGSLLRRRLGNTPRPSRSRRPRSASTAAPGRSPFRAVVLVGCSSSPSYCTTSSTGNTFRGVAASLATARRSSLGFRRAPAAVSAGRHRCHGKRCARRKPGRRNQPCPMRRPPISSARKRSGARSAITASPTRTGTAWP